MDMLDYKLAVFIERLYKITAAGINSIAKELGLPYSVFQSRVNQLTNLGFGFRGLIDVLKLKLREVYIITENDPPLYNVEEIKFLRNMSALIPRGGFLIFYLPFEITLDTFIRNLKKEYGIVTKEALEIVFKELKKTSLLRYRWSLRTLDNAWNLNEWHKIIEDFFNLIESPYFKESSEDFVKARFFQEYQHVMRYKKLPLDSLGLAVLKELEKDPLRRVRDIAEKVEIPFKKALKYVRTIISQGIYRGIRLRKTPWGRFTDLYVIVILRTYNFSNALAFTEAATRFPLNASTVIDTKGNTVTVFRINSKIYNVFKRFLEDVEHELGFKVEWLGASPLSLVKKYTIPFKQGFEYSKYKKGWLSEF